MLLTVTYVIYLILACVITVVVANTLSKNGEIFLIDGFNGNVELAKSINHMLVVGFYLVNLGFAFLQLEARRPLVTTDQALVFLSTKLGFVMFVLGGVHFFNVLIINKFKNAQKVRQYYEQTKVEEK